MENLQIIGVARHKDMLVFVYGFVYDFLTYCQDMLRPNDIIAQSKNRHILQDFVIQDIKILLSDKLPLFVTNAMQRDTGI